MLETKRLILALASFMSVSVFAEPLKLTLDQTLELAFKNSEALKIAAYEIGQAEDQIDQALSGALPHITTSGTYTRFLEAPVLQSEMGSFRLKKDFDLSLKAQVNQVVWAFGKVSNAVEAAKLLRNIKELSLSQARVEIAHQVKASFLQAILADKSLKIWQESVQNAKRNELSLRRRFASGRIPQFENLKMETDIALREPKVLEQEKTLEMLKSQLKFLTGIPQDTTIELVGDWLPQVTIEKAKVSLNEIYAQNLQLKLLESQKSLYEKQTQNERASRFPTIAAFAQVERAGTGSEYYIGGDNLNDTVAVGLSVTYDIWNGGRTSAVIESSLKDEQIAIQRQQQFKNQLSNELTTILTNLQKLDETLVASRRALNLAKNAYQLAVNRYESGQATQSDLNDAEQNLTNAKLGVESIEFQRQLEWINLEKLKAEIN